MPEAKTPKPADASATLTSLAASVAPTLPGKAAEPLPLPALGAVCTVRVAAGVDLMNNETGVLFEPEKDTPVTCTVTLLRRLQDGDLTLVA